MSTAYASSVLACEYSRLYVFLSSYRKLTLTGFKVQYI